MFVVHESFAYDILTVDEYAVNQAILMNSMSMILLLKCLIFVNFSSIVWTSLSLKSMNLLSDFPIDECAVILLVSTVLPVVDMFSRWFVLSIIILLINCAIDIMF